MELTKPSRLDTLCVFICNQVSVTKSRYNVEKKKTSWSKFQLKSWHWHQQSSSCCCFCCMIWVIMRTYWMQHQTKLQVHLSPLTVSCFLSKHLVNNEQSTSVWSNTDSCTYWGQKGSILSFFQPFWVCFIVFLITCWVLLVMLWILYLIKVSLWNSSSLHTSAEMSVRMSNLDNERDERDEDSHEDRGISECTPIKWNLSPPEGHSCNLLFDGIDR